MQKHDLEYFEHIAKVASESGFYGAKGARHTPAQCFMIILRGAELGVSPTTALQGLPLVFGHMTPSAGLLSVLLWQYGYTVRIHAHTDKVCELSLNQGGEILPGTTVSMSIEEARIARGPHGGSGPDLLEKYPKNMLFALAQRQLVRFHAPHILGGMADTDDQLGEEPEGRESTPGPMMQPGPASAEAPNHSLYHTIFGNIAQSMHEKGYAAEEADAYLHGIRTKYGAETFDQIPMAVWESLLTHIQKWPVRRQTPAQEPCGTAEVDAEAEAEAEEILF